MSPGIEQDRLENDDKFMRQLAQVVRNGLGDRAGTCIDPQDADRAGEAVPEGDLFVRSVQGTVKLSPDSARQSIRTRFSTAQPATNEQ